MFCIIFADLYLLYFTKFVQENGQLKLKLRLLEQQSHLQYEYYVSQEEKYNESVKILHDVNKHLTMIEQIYEIDRADDAKQYAKEIGKMLQPLVLQQYTNNPILNILLNEKKKYAVYHNIKFELKIESIDLQFMEPIEITTVFGNLLDNAIEACNALPDNRYISLKLDTYNDFVAIHISNSSSGHTKWSGRKPVSQKGKDHGIGLINVENIIKKYNGNMILKEENNVFSCDIIFNF
jgi:sensor histidine kinase regulating citrate/malate metabolism